MNNPKRNKTPWPTKDAMMQVYQEKLWGSGESKFYSGEGSHETKYVQPYVEAVVEFFKSFENPLTVCDLGCGDFNIGQQLAGFVKKYIAIDIVPDLIEFNRSHFKLENVVFSCLDISQDILPIADCVILRQVLQHLSNKEVLQIVKKLGQFKYIILTEHIPNGDFIPNKDIISGQGIRLKKHSGINILAAPFHLKIKEKRQLCSIQVGEGKGRIVTSLFKTHS